MVTKTGEGRKAVKDEKTITNFQLLRHLFVRKVKYLARHYLRDEHRRRF